MNPEDQLVTAATFNNASVAEVELPKENEREETIDKAFKAAILSLALTPLQVYVTYLLLKAAFLKGSLSEKHHGRLAVAIVINGLFLILASVCFCLIVFE